MEETKGSITKVAEETLKESLDFLDKASESTVSTDLASVTNEAIKAGGMGTASKVALFTGGAAAITAGVVFIYRKLAKKVFGKKSVEVTTDSEKPDDQQKLSDNEPDYGEES